ncbi:MAG: membrane protein insertion efficiency factor YidD [Candidatus Omnitrophica bacterium]|nr:membrane protein insertion efficiency factor YidD [Candidatus Omnitrophota bacterium]
MTKALLFVIRIYQKISRLLFVPSCRFYPSCSCYALEAIEKHGVFRGVLKTMFRILRCSPLSAGGHDPVR